MKKRELPVLYKVLILFYRERIILPILLGAAIYTFPLSFSEWQLLEGMKAPLNSAYGEIVSAWTIREETEEDWPVYGYEYIFYNPEIGQYSGVGFGENIYLDIGQQVLVDYNIENPHYNKASELDATRHPQLFAIIWLMAIVLITLSLVISTVKAVRKIKTIERGSLQMASQQSCELFRETENGPDEYEYLYEYENQGGKKTTDTITTTKTKRMKYHTPVAILSDKVVYIALMPKTVEKFILKNLMSPGEI